MGRRLSNWMMDIPKGKRFQVTGSIDTKGLIHWSAPLTSSFSCIIPEGAILVAANDYGRLSLGFACTPEEYATMELLLVPADQRMAPKYAGYSFAFSRFMIGKALRPL